MALGVLILAWTLWEMTGWTPDVSMTTRVTATILQGVGLGFVFIPLNLVAFATLDPALRTDGTSLISLLRNLGSAIGISAMAAMLTRNTQVVHADLAMHVSPLNRVFDMPAVHRWWGPSTVPGTSLLDQEITRQASIIAHADDDWLLMILALGMLVLLPLMNRPPKAAAPDPAHAAMD